MINGGGIKPRVLICIITRGRHAPVMHCPVYNADNKSAVSPNNAQRQTEPACSIVGPQRRGFNRRLPAGVTLNLSALRDVADVTSAGGELQDAVQFSSRIIAAKAAVAVNCRKPAADKKHADDLPGHGNAVKVINVKRWQRQS